MKRSLMPFAQNPLNCRLQSRHGVTLQAKYNMRILPANKPTTQKLTTQQPATSTLQLFLIFRKKTAHVFHKSKGK
jgi:hypothetical protein